MGVAAAGLSVAVLLVGCRRSGAPSDQRDPRWSVSSELVMARSLDELTNRFGMLNRDYRWTIQTTTDPDFAIISRYAHPGIRSFEVYCYEKVVDGFWHLRSVNFFHVSDSMEVQVEKIEGAVRLVHDGRSLFTVHSALRQVVEQTMAPMARGKQAIPSNR